MVSSATCSILGEKLGLLMRINSSRCIKVVCIQSGCDGVCKKNDFYQAGSDPDFMLSSFSFDYRKWDNWDGRDIWDLDGKDPSLGNRR